MSNEVSLESVLGVLGKEPKDKSQKKAQTKEKLTFERNSYSAPLGFGKELRKRAVALDTNASEIIRLAVKMYFDSLDEEFEHYDYK